MVQGKNKGHWYEDGIAQKLLERKIVVKQICPNHKYEKFSSVQEKCPSCNVDLQLTAGSGNQEDVIFRHEGKDFSLEIKNNSSDPDWGQCKLTPTLKNGKWVWDYSDKAKKTKSKLLEYYNQYEFKDGSKGLVEYLKNKNIIPNKHRIPNKELTFAMRKEDQKKFEDTKHKISTLSFAKFHEKKSDYVQVGRKGKTLNQKYGFYHINNDSANLGTEQFDAEFTLRFRAKTINTHFPICPKCGKERAPGTKPKCNSCKIEIPKDYSIGHKCPTCFKYEKKEKDKNEIIPYKKFNHRNDDYDFFVIILNPKIKKISKFNIEKEDGQEFPPIHS
uniref:Uncharacterized protein n=1 Tax=uncultured marine thaumarchaeote KM3_26_B10 TaxID=1456107 RepID=A0A075GW91_9ARCH|nr:hypothetical protein [uncultured marine thaumarchaeote KM3_26_B10]